MSILSRKADEVQRKTDGNLVFQGGNDLERINSGHQNYTRITQALVDGADEKNGTLCFAEGSVDKELVRKRRTKCGHNILYFMALQNDSGNNTDINTYRKQGLQGAFAACWGRIENEYQR